MTAFDRVLQDARYGVRLIRRTPGSSLGVIVTLALAITRTLASIAGWFSWRWA